MKFYIGQSVFVSRGYRCVQQGEVRGYTLTSLEGKDDSIIYHLKFDSTDSSRYVLEDDSHYPFSPNADFMESKVFGTIEEAFEESKK